MKKTLYFLLLCITAALFSCSEDDFQTIPNEEVVQNAGREERFFLMRDFSVSGKSSAPTNSIDNSFIEKLKILNKKNQFVCELSDQKGLPLWQYSFRTGDNNVQNKGGEDGDNFLIIPMQEEGNQYLSSLLYIKNPDSENPEIYTITNDELLSFVENQEIEKYDRENVLMTFFYFDQQLFGEEREYVNIPSDLFDKIPLKEEHETKNFTFSITQDENSGEGKSTIWCVTYYHCPFPPGGCSGPNGSCDGCIEYCSSEECYSLGGGHWHGGTPTGPGGGNSGGNSGGSGDWEEPETPWYLIPYISNYTHHVQNTFKILYHYGIVFSEYELDYLQDHFPLVQKINIYLGANPSEYNKVKYIRDVIYFLLANPQTVHPNNILERIDALEQYLYDHPYAISNIPCDQIPYWQEVVQYQVPQSVKDKLSYLNQTRPGENYDWALQYIENANGPNVNNDYFSVTFRDLPQKPAPHDSQQFTAEEFLSYVRTNISEFVHPDMAVFTPSSQTGFNEGAIWYSNNPINSIIHIDIPGDDGSVITTGNYTSQHNSYWIFSTIQTPWEYFTDGLDGPHPVSGNRKFGLKKNSNGTYTFYTRGVDRFQGYSGHEIIDNVLQNTAFSKADQLWQSFQYSLMFYVLENSINSDNYCYINTPSTWRPDYNKVKNVLINNAPLSSLGCQ